MTERQEVLGSLARALRLVGVNHRRERLRPDRQPTTAGSTSTYSYDALGRALQAGFTATGNDLAADSAYVRDTDTDTDVVGTSSGGNYREVWTDLHDDVVGSVGDLPDHVGADVGPCDHSRFPASGDAMITFAMERESASMPSSSMPESVTST